MGKRPELLISVFLVSVAWGASGFDTALIPAPPLLRDGFILRGIDGRLSGPDSNDAWYFEPAADVSDFSDVLKTGTKLQMLPSSTLEKMIADGRSRSEMAFRLWNGRVTRYKGRNFIFPSFFLPVREPKEREISVEPPVRPNGEAPPVQQTKDDPITRDPNDVLTIPSDLLRKLRDTRKAMAARERRIVDGNSVPAIEPNMPDDGKAEPAAERYSGGSDSVLVDKTGYLIGQDDGSFIFKPDALGRKVDRLSLRLLPCKTLELAELRVSADFEPVRLRIAGILTKYKDTDYLLLQKATPTYSHGNFGR